MTSIAGRKAKALPSHLINQLTEIGYLQMEDLQGVPFFRHPRQRLMYLQVVLSNMPGDTDIVIAKWYGRDAMKRIKVDELVGLLHLQHRALVDMINAPPKAGRR